MRAGAGEEDRGTKALYQASSYIASIEGFTLRSCERR